MSEPLNIQWKRGVFQTFYALIKIRVGGLTEISINAGDEFEYDGSVLKYEGREIPQPSLRGSFRQGWVSDAPLGEDGAHVPAKRASRNVASAQSVNRNLSHVQRGGQREITTDSLDEDTIINVSDRAAVRNGRSGHLTTEHNRRQASARGMQINQDEMEVQDSVPIGRIRTSTHFKGDITKPQNANLKDKLENLSGSGFIMDENAPVMEPQHHSGRVVHREGVTIKTSVGNLDRTVRPEADDDGVEVGRVRHSASNRRAEGVSVSDTSNIRGEKETGSKIPARATYKVNASVNPKVRIARAIDPNFPEDWSFVGKLADRLAAIKKHGATPEFLEALYAAEGDQMRKALSKAYPKQFA